MKAYIIFLILICFTFAQDDPTPPVWPEQFEQTFNEDMSYYGIISGHTTGSFFYDYVNRRYRVDRANAKCDRFCGTVYKLQDNACSHIVVGGNRYLYFPDKNYCCNCCSDEHGCGVLVPNWLDGAKFIGLETAPNGTVLEKWDKQGIQNNFVYVTHDDKRIMTKIDQQPNDVQNFSVSSFYKGIRDPKVFDLPAKCDPELICPWDSICTVIRKKKYLR